VELEEQDKEQMATDRDTEVKRKKEKKKRND
jgi:hypothetical protein